MRVPVTAGDDPYRRLAAIAHTTRDGRSADPGATAAVLGPAFRILARLGMFRWLVDRQRLVTTMVTNLRGPDAHLSFLAAPISNVIPVVPITGNVTVAFAVLSYAGTLVVTIVADPQRCPDLPVLVAHLQSELNLLATDLERAAVAVHDLPPPSLGPTELTDLPVTSGRDVDGRQARC
jgi:hypothetical protein